MYTGWSSSTHPSSSEPGGGLTAGLSGGTTGGMIPTIIRTGTIPGGTGTTAIMITGGTDGTPGIIAGSTGAIGGTGPPGGLSNQHWYRLMER